MAYHMAYLPLRCELREDCRLYYTAGTLLVLLANPLPFHE
jgi:hypothetical protein